MLLIACWRRWMQASSPARATTTAPWTRSSCACLRRQMPTWMGTIVVEVTAATARLASGGLLVRRAASHEPPRALRQHRRRAQGAGATKIGQLAGAARGVRRVFLSYHALHHQHAQCARHACAVWPARAWPASPPTRSRRAARAPTLTRPFSALRSNLRSYKGIPEAPSLDTPARRPHGDRSALGHPPRQPAYVGCARAYAEFV